VAIQSTIETAVVAEVDETTVAALRSEAMGLQRSCSELCEKLAVSGAVYIHTGRGGRGPVADKVTNEAADIVTAPRRVCRLTMIWRLRRKRLLRHKRLRWLRRGRVELKPRMTAEGYSDVIADMAGDATDNAEEQEATSEQGGHATATAATWCQKRKRTLKM
jgi:hypothetical protein